ncbi:MAG: hypothetical protein AAFR16_12865 [Pseudomonadota bacterium]
MGGAIINAMAHYGELILGVVSFAIGLAVSRAHSRKAQADLQTAVAELTQKIAALIAESRSANEQAAQLELATRGSAEGDTVIAALNKILAHDLPQDLTRIRKIAARKGWGRFLFRFAIMFVPVPLAAGAIQALDLSGAARDEVSNPAIFITFVLVAYFIYSFTTRKEYRANVRGKLKNTHLDKQYEQVKTEINELSLTQREYFDLMHILRATTTRLFSKDRLVVLIEERRQSAAASALEARGAVA